MDSLPAAATLSILHLEDSVHDHRLVCRTLDAAVFPYSIARVDTLAVFTELATSGKYDLILADYRLPGFTAVDAWSALPDTSNRPPAILLSSAIGEAAAVSAIHLGISDYLHKDDLSRLQRVIQRTMDVYRAHNAKAKADQALARSEKRLSELTGYLQTAIEKERAAISREIHDDIGGSLAAANLDLAWIARHGSNPDMQAHVQAATEMIQHALGASQRIMMNLRPSILDQGLFAAVQWLASGFERRTGIKTFLRANNEDLCPEVAVQLTAYRTTQEALTNISKYARCSLVQIEISDAENFLTIEITDNGVGITEQEMLKPDAFGIRGLYERAKTIGGWLDVSTRQGLGTSLILSVPLNTSAKLVPETPFK
jgi:signal transduction histidine kinase